jgi:hypothetical protein
MAIAFDAVSYSTEPADSTTTYAHTVSAVLENPVLFVHTNLVSAAPGVVASITYGGEDLQLLDWNEFIDGGNQQRQEVWYLFAPPTGPNNIITTWGGWGVLTSTGISWVGAAALGAHAKTSKGTTAPTNIQVILNSEADELCVDFLSVKNVGGVDGVQGAGQTIRANLFSGGVGTDRHGDQSSDEAGAAAVTMSWTITTLLAAGLIGVPLKPFVPFVSRSIEYTLDAWDPEQRIFDANGHMVPRYKIKPNNWCRIVGLESITAEVYADNFDDPTLVYFESVSYDGETDEVQIVTNRGDLPEVIMARLATGSTG